jgi:hypothetical protein
MSFSKMSIVFQNFAYPLPTPAHARVTEPSQCRSQECRSRVHNRTHTPLRPDERSTFLRSTLFVAAKMIALKGPDGAPVFESIAITLVTPRCRTNPLPCRNEGLPTSWQVCEECLKSEHPEK